MVTTKHFGLDTDSTFANDTDYTIPSTKAVKTALSNKQNINTAVTHTASTAAGSATQPVYVAADGTATATTYSLAKSVPADAVFTDTTYSAFTGADGTTAGVAGLVPAPAATDNTKFLKGDGTWTAVSGTVAIDNSTITNNSSDQLQTVAIINKNSSSTSPLGIWQGTETQWNQGEAITWYNWVNSDYTMATRTLSTSSNWRGAASDGSKAILVSSNSSTYLYTTNGTSWSSGTFSSGIKPFWIIYGNNTWVAINNTTDVVYSSDGSSWSTSSMPASYKNGLIYGEKFITTSGSNLYYSTDGSSWQTVDVSSQNINFTASAYGNNKYVAITRGTSITISDDAATWSNPTSVFSESMSYIAYGNGRFVALPSSSSSRTVAYSEDGVTWTEVANALPQALGNWDFAFTGGAFIATSYQSANACYSLDGVTWKSMTLPSSLTWTAKTSLGNEILIIGYDSNQYAAVTLTNLSVYTTDENPTTASTVYDDKNVVSTYTITSVGTGTITLSNSKTYNYNSAGNLFDYITVGELHPDWLCNISNIGLKLGDVVIADATTVDQTYSGTSTNAQSGVAVKSAIDTAVSSVYKAAGSVVFASLPTLGKAIEGNVYNVIDTFTTTSDFVEGAGISYPAGTNVVCINTSDTTYKWDVLAGFVDLSGYQPTSTAVTHTASTAAGSSLQPVYVNSSGVATACTYELNKSVPSDAVFTDTTYSAFVGAGSSTDGDAGLVKKPVAGDNVKYLKGDGTWASIAYTELTNVPSSFAPAAHTHVTQDVTALTGYTIASTAASIAATDTLNEALGKLQKSIDGKQASGNYVPETRTVNSKALSADITLTASDVGALSSSTVIPTATYKVWS